LGYSGRYHAASLAAVFLALAVGVLIGAALGDNLVSDTEENLRESLEGDIERARADADEAREDLEREREFAGRAYPALVGETLADRRIAILALGGLSGEVTGDVERALEPAGAELVEVAVVRIPPDVSALADRLPVRRPGQIEEDEGRLREIARRLGREFVTGRGRLLSDVRDALFLRSSGEGGRLDGVVLVRETGDLDPEERADTEALESGLIEGMADTPAEVVGVERSDAEESSVPFFSGFGIATVDSVELTSGRVALVFTLLGADGNFGIKQTAGALLPELLEPARDGQR